MMKREKCSYCINCRKTTEYSIRKVSKKYSIRDSEYDFDITEAVCKECGEIMSIPGIIDYNVLEVDRQYRERENLITIEKIKKIMSIYHMGKAPLSYALGFGEITITRYLSGQVPSKEYSDIMIKALESHEYMEHLLELNKIKVGEKAYNKAKKAIIELKETFGVSEKMIEVISYIFKKVDEITPLALQKILYYVQALYIVKYNKRLFEENCQAWVHGPVYKDVYMMFRDFKYNPIDDNRFAYLEEKYINLSEEIKEVVNLVLETFGRYSGKVLENITHKEEPWINAREGCFEDELCNEEILLSDIEKYFTKINNKYNLMCIEGINSYIDIML